MLPNSIVNILNIFYQNFMTKDCNFKYNQTRTSTYPIIKKIKNKIEHSNFDFQGKFVPAIILSCIFSDFVILRRFGDVSTTNCDTLCAFVDMQLNLI